MAKRCSMQQSGGPRLLLEEPTRQSDNDLPGQGDGPNPQRLVEKSARQTLDKSLRQLREERFQWFDSERIRWREISRMWQLQEDRVQRLTEEKLIEEEENKRLIETRIRQLTEKELRDNKRVLRPTETGRRPRRYAALGYQSHKSIGLDDHMLPFRGRFDVQKDTPEQREKPFVEIMLNGEKYDALADTMASENVMTKAYAKKIGATVDLSKRHTFKNACGKSFKSVGETAVEVSFPDDPSKRWMCSFAVLKTCPVPLVVSDSFLRFTEILTKFKHRLKRVANATQKYWRVMYMDMPRRQLECSIDGMRVSTSADTGSDVDIVSLDYVRTRGWKINAMGPDEGFVELSDGGIVKLAGYVESWLKVGTTSSRQTFYVLEGLQCDVLLGDGTLHELDVFNQHESLFQDLQPAETGIFHFIKWLQQVEDHARQIIQNDYPSGFWVAKPAIPDQKQPWRRMIHRMGLCKTSAADNLAWKEAFERSLDIIGTIEADERDRVTQQMKALAGSELSSAKDKEESRQLQYQVRRDRIIQQQAKFLSR